MSIRLAAIHFGGLLDMLHYAPADGLPHGITGRFVVSRFESSLPQLGHNLRRHLFAVEHVIPQKNKTARMGGLR